MKFSQENAQDIKKYFQGSFVKFTGMPAKLSDGTVLPDTGEVLHTVERVDGNLITGKRFDPEGEIPYEFRLYPEETGQTPEVEFVLPRRSYFNFDGLAFYLYRIPARQYKKGITTENTAVTRLRNDGNFEPYHLDINVLKAYVDKKAFHKFNEDLTSYAVSNRMAVAGGKVFLDQARIGSINFKNKAVHVNQAMFVSEVERVLKTHGQDNWKVFVEEKPKTKAKKVTEKYGIDDKGNVVEMENE